MSKPAATVGCHHTCPLPDHVGGPVIQGSSDVFINGKPACRQGDKLSCQKGSDALAIGSGTVFINGRPAGRVGDPSEHGGKIVEGNTAVFVA